MLSTILHRCSRTEFCNGNWDTISHDIGAREVGLNSRHMIASMAPFDQTLTPRTFLPTLFLRKVFRLLCRFVLNAVACVETLLAENASSGLAGWTGRFRV